MVTTRLPANAAATRGSSSRSGSFCAWRSISPPVRSVAHSPSLAPLLHSLVAARVSAHCREWRGVYAKRVALSPHRLFRAKIPILNYNNAVFWEVLCYNAGALEANSCRKDCAELAHFNDYSATLVRQREMAWERLRSARVVDMGSQTSHTSALAVALICAMGRPRLATGLLPSNQLLHRRYMIPAAAGAGRAERGVPRLGYGGGQPARAERDE